MSKTRHIFWTGGFDSTYYLTRCLFEGETVQPHYIMSTGDGRESQAEELRTMNEWRELVRQRYFPGFRNLLPLNVIRRLPEDPALTKAWTKAGCGNRPEDLVGRQYEAMARYAKAEGLHVACCAEQGGRLHRNIEAVRKLPGASSLQFVMLEVDKGQMLAWAHEKSVPLSSTWSCWHPVDGRPCGLCQMCRERVVSYSPLNVGKAVNLSIIFNVLNRSRAKALDYTLRLFPNCLHSVLTSLRKMPSAYQIIVVDWGSTDWPINDWVPGLLHQFPVSRYDHITPEGVFNRGEGRNLGAAAAIGDVLCFLDADMLVTSPEFFRDGLRVAASGTPVFPICYSFDDPKWLTGCWRGSESTAVRGAGEGSSGNLFISREQWERTGGFKSRGEGFEKWGREDIDFRKRCFREFRNIDRRRAYGFYHQWHPTDPDWVDQHLPEGVGEGHKPARRGKWPVEPCPSDAIDLRLRGDYLGDMVERAIVGGK